MRSEKSKPLIVSLAVLAVLAIIATLAIPAWRNHRIADHLDQALRAGEAAKLVVMEAEGFHPLNPRARGAFAALAEIEGVDTVGVISAAGDAEDAAEMVAAFRFRRLIVTGLDRTRRLGALAAAATAGAGLAHVLKDGALEKLSPDDLAAALLA